MAEYFYNANGDAIPQSYVEDGGYEYKGQTLDGDRVYHVTYHDKHRQKHISYDTVEVRGRHYYIHGSGHERNDVNGEIIRWDMQYTNRITWYEALGRHTDSLISKR